MVDLVRAGGDPADLAREFEPTAQSISHWVAQADRQEGRREEKGTGLVAAERDEVARLRRENKQLRLERDILSRAAAWFARETGAIPPGSSNSERASGFLSGRCDGARARRVGVWLSRLATPTAFGAYAGRCGAAEADPNDPRQLARDLRRTSRSR
jgi:transposase